MHQAEVIPETKPDSYTRHVTVTTATDELVGFIHPDHDLSDTFLLWDEDLGRILVIKGYLAEVNDVD